MKIHLLFIIGTVYTYAATLCSVGCVESCLANNTCKKCGENYFEDTSCLYCKWTDPDATSPVAYIRGSNNECVSVTNLLKKTGWCPSDGDVTELTLDKSTSFKFDSDTQVDYGICYYKQKYRMGHWFKVNTTNIDTKHMRVSVNKTVSTEKLFIDMTNTLPNELNPKCMIHSCLDAKTQSILMGIPIETNPLRPDNNTNYYYIFISIDAADSFEGSITVSPQPLGDSGNFHSIYKLAQEDIDPLAEDLSSELVLHFPLESSAMFDKPVCVPNVVMKYQLFRVNFTGNYSLLLDSRRSDKTSYLQEFSIGKDGKLECVNLWSSITSNNQTGLVVKLDPKPTPRFFFIMTEEQRTDIDVSVRVICPSDCNGNGDCVPSEGKCLCKEGYGGVDCHLLCFYNNQWQVEDNENLCYYGSKMCNDTCGCAKGYELVDHFCISSQCSEGKLGPTDDCYMGTEGCLTNCECDPQWRRTEDHLCKSALCGNNQIDVYHSHDGSVIREEECDGGTNCDNYCRCIEGYIPDKDNPLACMKKSNTKLIIILSCSCFVVALLLLIVAIVIIVLKISYKKVDLEVFKTQQPTYHYYIGGSSSSPPSKEKARYEMDPIQLDYGNGEAPTDINETRFERIDVRNNSRSKYMMIIVHTPNTSKYVFHFEPQVCIIPRKSQRVITSYMTLHCTTKIRDMRIPYTVWFSKNKKVLKDIAELLKDKTFDDWTPDDQESMELLAQSVKRRSHYFFTIKTEAANSTFIDIDEIRMYDQPIAEGAMGKLYIGMYRTMEVAVKEFKWDDLDEESMALLKQDVINECKIMSKLRNPYIANYIGSVTHIPQISMVIQFFTLGCLGEYLREEKEDYVLLPYKLKIRMLYDTTRGMTFLHDNNILHLDLKPDNLLVNSLYADSACCIKITDFGTSRFTKRIGSEDRGLGTPVYSAPETYYDIYTPACDVFSYAITAWEIFYQKEPYKDFKSVFDIKKSVQSGERLNIDETMPDILKSIIEQCWAQECTSRPSFATITRLFSKINDESLNRPDLDAGVDQAKIEELVQRRTERKQKLINEINLE